MNKDNYAEYRASYYKENEKKMIWAESKEKLFALARADVPDAKDNALMYVSRYNQEQSAYEQEGRYLFMSGKDVTRIKLNIASMSKEQFDTVKEHIKEMGAEFDVQKKAWYVLRSDENKDMIEAYLKAQAEKSNRTFENEHTEAYIAISYLKEGTKSADVRYGENIGEMLSNLQDINAGRTENEKLSMTYIKQLNSETNQYDIFVGRFNTDTGRNITKMYLTLPQMMDNEFFETVKYLRENGAKFDSSEKKWYITADGDLNKFVHYLSISGKEQDAPSLEPVHEQNTEREELLDFVQEEHKEESADQQNDKKDFKKETVHGEQGRNSLLNRLHEKQGEVAKEVQNERKEKQRMLPGNVIS